MCMVYAVNYLLTIYMFIFTRFCFRKLQVADVTHSAVIDWLVVNF